LPPGWLALGCASRSAVDEVITLHSFHKMAPEKDTKVSGIRAVAIALIALGKSSATVAATYSLSAIKDAVAHFQWSGKLLRDAGQI